MLHGEKMKKLIKILNTLEEANIYYKLDKCNDEYIMIDVAIPGERWEIEVSDEDIRIERFKSYGDIMGEEGIELLLEECTD